MFFFRHRYFYVGKKSKSIWKQESFEGIKLFSFTFRMREKYVLPGEKRAIFVGPKHKGSPDIIDLEVKQASLVQ